MSHAYVHENCIQGVWVETKIYEFSSKNAKRLKTVPNYPKGLVPEFNESYNKRYRLLLTPNSIKSIIVVGTMGQSRAVVNELVRSDSERTLASDRYRDISDVLPQLEWRTNITDAKSSFAYTGR